MAGGWGTPKATPYPYLSFPSEDLELRVRDLTAALERAALEEMGVLPKMSEFGDTPDDQPPVRLQP